MKITQPDSRTVRIQSDSGAVFHLPYRFFWDGHDREPVSVALETSASGGKASAVVTAFFLFGKVSDRITSDPMGITIARTWKVETPGAVRLLMDIVFETPDPPSFLFPGLFAGQGFPEAPLSFLGDKTSYPVSVIAALGERGVLVFSRASRLEGALASIGMRRAVVEDEPDRLHVEVRFPGSEEPTSRVGPRPDHVEEPGEPTIESPGSLERSHSLYLAFARREEILTAAPAAVLGRLHSAAGGKTKSPAPIDVEALREAARGVLSTHLVAEGGVTGLREVPGSPWISSKAGAALAVVLLRLFPGDADMRETALRLADFSLKGQLPSGVFFENHFRETAQWRGVKGQPERTVLSMAHSAEIADLLLTFSEDLAAAGLPGEKYFLAGQRFVDFFIDEKSRLALPGTLYVPGEQLAFGEAERKDSRSSRTPPPQPVDIGGLALFFPLVRVHERTGRDRYKKALDVIARRFSTGLWDPLHPPASRDGRGADSAASLAAVRLFIGLRTLGYKPTELPSSGAAAAKAHAAESVQRFASLLVPWVRTHGGQPDDSHSPLLEGAIADGFIRQRLLFAGYETAYLLLCLRKLGGKRDVGALLESLARLCLTSARNVPIGTSHCQHAHWDENGKPEEGQGRWGPIDSRRLASEALHGLLIASEFPKLGRPT